VTASDSSGSLDKTIDVALGTRLSIKEFEEADLVIVGGKIAKDRFGGADGTYDFETGGVIAGEGEGMP